MAGEWGWRLHWQDFTTHRFGQRKPAPMFEDFPTREAADAAKLRFINRPAVVATVAPVPMPRATKASLTKARDAACVLISVPVSRKPC